MTFYDEDNPYKLTLVVGNRLGIHARPSMAISDVASGFDGKIHYHKEGNEPVDATSVLNVLMQCPSQGEIVHFYISPKKRVPSGDIGHLRNTIAELENIVCHDDD